MRTGAKQIKPAVLVACAALAGCNDENAPLTPGGPGPVATVAIVPLTAFVPIDTTIALAAVARDSAGVVIPDAHVLWSTRDSTIATVDTAGILRGRQFGAVSITAMVGDKSGSAVASVVLRWRALSAGGTYTCGVTVTGVGYCWGNNAAAQLGVGAADLDQHPVPLKIVGVPRLADIATSGPIAAHTCALTVAGALYCWGDNTYGEIGNHDTAQALAPTAVGGTAVYTAVTLGDWHTCALSQQRASCWGRNASGQLGAATGADPLAIKAVSGGLVLNSISAGPNFTCGISTAPAAWCWGDNTLGQFGTGSTGSGSTTPVKSASGLSLAALDAGRGASVCGLVPPDQIECWGSNGSGQLGRGFAAALDASPDALAGSPSFISVAVGLAHACALSLDGHASCWGAAGLLGISSGTASTRPVSVEHTTPFVFMTTGTNHTCALTADGTAYCWGRNDLGQLGTGSVSAVQLVPVKVADHP